MKVILLIFFLVVCAELAMADVVINEIMYNPDQCSDSDCEWIELYNSANESINLSEWKIDGNNFDDSIIEANGYVVIARNIGGYNSYYTSVNYTVVDGSFVLSNSGDIISLTNGTYTDTLDYSSTWGANGNNYTLEKINPNETNTQDNWGTGLIKDGTPGMKNSVYGTGGIDYSVILIDEFLPNPHGDDDAPMPQGEWIELYNSGDRAINLKWAFFKDLFGHTIYITDTTTVDTTIILSNGFLVVYTNGFFGFLNNDGAEELKFYSKDNVLVNEVSYEGSDEGSSWAKVDDYWQKTMPTPEEENVDHTGVKDSKFDIEKIYDLGSDNIAKFGQTIRVKVNVYKGDDTKSVVRLWVADGDRKISKESKITISTKYTHISLAVPIQLKPNCNEKYDEGDYTIFVGWTSESTAKDTFPIRIEDITSSMCEKVKVKSSSTTSSKKFIYELISKPLEVGAGNSFETETKLTNNDDEDIHIDVWSYVYRGSKSYSGEREANQKSFVLKKAESRSVKLMNKLDSDAKAGDYKFKVKIRKDNQKTTKDITESITVVGTESNKGCVAGESDETEYEYSKPYVRYNPVTIYESSSLKAKKTIPYFMIGAFGLLSLMLLLKV